MTIYALSSGPGISGVAVIRISGQNCSKVIKSMTVGSFPRPRVATLKKINKINTNELIDEGIIIWFPGPNSYTGENLAEIHVHGSRAVISQIHLSISNIKNFHRIILLIGSRFPEALNNLDCFLDCLKETVSLVKKLLT